VNGARPLVDRSSPGVVRWLAKTPLPSIAGSPRRQSGVAAVDRSTSYRTRCPSPAAPAPGGARKSVTGFYGRRGALIAGTAIFLGIRVLALGVVDFGREPLIGVAPPPSPVLGAASSMPRHALPTITTSRFRVPHLRSGRRRSANLGPGFARAAGGTLGIPGVGRCCSSSSGGVRSFSWSPAGLAALSCIGVILVVASTRSGRSTSVSTPAPARVLSAIGNRHCSFLGHHRRVPSVAGRTTAHTLVGLDRRRVVAFPSSCVQSAVELAPPTEPVARYPRLFQSTAAFANRKVGRRCFLQFFAMFGFFFRVAPVSCSSWLGYSTFEAALGPCCP